MEYEELLKKLEEKCNNNDERSETMKELLEASKTGLKVLIALKDKEAWSFEEIMGVIAYMRYANDLFDRAKEKGVEVE